MLAPATRKDFVACFAGRSIAAVSVTEASGTGALTDTLRPVAALHPVTSRIVTTTKKALMIPRSRCQGIFALYQAYGRRRHARAAGRRRQLIAICTSTPM
jgi:hypothetical protein